MQFNFKTLWGSERPWGGPKSNGWSCTWVNCWGGGWEYQDAGGRPLIWILTIWQCSACPCTPSCLPWATQPSTSSLSTSREPSCQCWRQCHGTKWILGFDFILLGSFECEWTGCWLWRHTLPGKSIRGTGGRLLHTWRRYSSQSISWFLQTTNYIR